MRKCLRVNNCGYNQPLKHFWVSFWTSGFYLDRELSVETFLYGLGLDSYGLGFEGSV